MAKGAGGRPSARMRLWEHWIAKFSLDRAKVAHKRSVYTAAFAEQLANCKSDDARMIILGITL